MPTLLPIRSVVDMDSSVSVADYESESKQFVVQCPEGSAVGKGLFYCSADGKQECCDSKENGLGIATSESLARASTANPATASDPNSNTPSGVITTSNPQSGSIAGSQATVGVSTTTSSSSSAWSTDASGHPTYDVGKTLTSASYASPGIVVVVVLIGFLIYRNGWRFWRCRSQQQVVTAPPQIVTAPPQTLSSAAPNTVGDNSVIMGTETYGIELNELQATAETAAQTPELPTIPVSASGQEFELPAGPSHYRDFPTDGVNDVRHSSDFLNPVAPEEMLESGPSNAQTIPDVQGDIDETPLRQESATAAGSDSPPYSVDYGSEIDVMRPPSYEAATSTGQVDAGSSAAEQGERVTGAEGMLNAPAGSRRRRSTNTRQAGSP
ncbi:MAG: hypothetical protein OHK93_000863 [Ramalina farinacea]|uniref:Uncharacterized protein n=1 Tax=Ramalina farinacea TaxID=258253 RepID=A0AA43QSP2_9LECA|nr:hypothetical protein [Ramalina farinacea]